MSRTKARAEKAAEAHQQDPRHAHEPETHQHPVDRARRMTGPQRRVGLPEGADRKRMSNGYRTSPRSGG